MLPHSFGVVSARSLDLAAVLVLDLQLSHSLLPDLVVSLQLVVLLLICSNGKNKWCVCLLFGHELGDDLTNIGVIGFTANFLEALLDVSILLHFFSHAYLKEGGPKAVHEQWFSQVKLFDVSWIILCKFSDFLLSLMPSKSLLQRILLVLNRFLKSCDSFLSLFLLVVDHLH